MNLRNFWKDFNSNLSQRVQRSPVGNLISKSTSDLSKDFIKRLDQSILSAIPIAAREWTRFLDQNFLENRQNYRISELTADHVVLRYYPKKEGAQGFISEATFFALEAWDQFLKFQKSKNPTLRFLDFSVEKLETEFWVQSLSQQVSPSESLSLTLHWTLTEREILRARFINEFGTEDESNYVINEILPLQVFNKTGQKLAHLSLHYRVKKNKPTEISYSRGLK